jgi:hypothetical protein
MEIQNLLSKIQAELCDSSMNSQRVRYLKNYYEELTRYLNRHPEASKVPSHLELFCDENPDALECRIYNV